MLAISDADIRRAMVDFQSELNAMAKAKGQNLPA
jgi:hypothetical protein